MALTLRFLGQTTKQAPQILTARTPRGCAGGSATPRTPLRSVSSFADKSPFLAGEASPFLGIFDKDASSPRACLLNGSFSLAEKSYGFESRARGLPSHLRTQQPFAGGATSATLLQRLSAHASNAEEPTHMQESAAMKELGPDPESVRQAVLSRQNRVAARVTFQDSAEHRVPPSSVLLGRESAPQPSRPKSVTLTTQEEPDMKMAQAARDAFLSKMKAQASRRVANCM